MFQSLNRRCCMALIAATTLLAIDLHAQENERGFWSMQMENDMLGNGNDGHYTAGTLLSHLTRHRPRWLRKVAGILPCGPCRDPETVKYEFGQRIYTPSDTSRSDLVVGDRPYAGWLYMGAGLSKETQQLNGVRTDIVSLKIGVIGPASQAQRAQSYIHKKRNLRMPRGWDNQLRNEPGFVLEYKRSWRRSTQRQWGFGFDGTPYVVGTLGNVHTYLGAGMTLRGGFNLAPEQTLQRQTTGSLHAFLNIEGRAVAHNIFLDGNTWVASHRVDKRPTVGDIQFGLSFVAANLEIRLSQTIRSREFYGQYEPDRFGMITVAYRP